VVLPARLDPRFGLGPSKQRGLPHLPKTLTEQAGEIMRILVLDGNFRTRLSACLCEFNSSGKALKRSGWENRGSWSKPVGPLSVPGHFK